MIALFSAVMFMKMRLMMGWWWNVVLFLIAMLAALVCWWVLAHCCLSSLCAAWPLVDPSSDRSAWWRFQLPVYIVFCVCGTGISLILSRVCALLV
jgi:hypothetical protein